MSEGSRSRPDGQGAAPTPRMPHEVSASDEANHRIANSLQLVLAMISVESRTVSSPEALRALEATQRRINAVAAVHRHLHEARQVEAVDLALYLRKLAEDLEVAGSPVDGLRRITVDAVPGSVRSEEAIALGIIVCEIVTNACKHAYGIADEGDIRVTLRQLGNGGYELAVEDRGQGLLQDAHHSGLGMRLVELMASRIGASCEFQDACPGTRFALRVGAG